MYVYIPIKPKLKNSYLYFPLVYLFPINFSYNLYLNEKETCINTLPISMSIDFYLNFKTKKISECKLQR